MVLIKCQAIMCFSLIFEESTKHSQWNKYTCMIHVDSLFADSRVLFADSTETVGGWLCFPLWYGWTGDLILGREGLPRGLNILQIWSFLSSLFAPLPYLGNLSFPALVHPVPRLNCKWFIMLFMSELYICRKSFLAGEAFVTYWNAIKPGEH